MKSKPLLVSIARELYNTLSKYLNIAFNTTRAIGYRYRHVDEVRMPFYITINFHTIKKRLLQLGIGILLSRLECL